MTSYLSPKIHLAVIGADVVVLDTRQNAYFCLPDAAAGLSVGSDGVVFDDPGLTQDFEQAGFLSPAPSLRADPPSLPSRDLALRVAQRVATRDILLILAGWATMAFSYHVLPFDRLLAQACRRRQAELASDVTEDLKGLVASFEKILPWLPFQGVCLYRAFLLLRILRWRGHDARWMFGVRTWPFQAHCWLQVGDTVLDDTADRLAGFAPILAV